MKRFMTCLVFAFCSISFADEVHDSLDRIHAAYDNGELRACLSHLEGAIRLVREQLVRRIGECLPDGFNDWEPMNTSAGSAAFSDRTVRVSKLFYNSVTGGSVEIVIAFDRSRAGVLRSWIANPLELRRDNSNARLQVIGAQRFVLSFDEREKHGEARTALANSVVIEFIGDGLAEVDDLIDFAGRLDVDKLQEAMR